MQFIFVAFVTLVIINEFQKVEKPETSEPSFARKKPSFARKKPKSEKSYNISQRKNKNCSIEIHWIIERG